MAYKLITAPSSEPVSLAEAKLHLKLDADTTDDTLITALISAARDRCEQYCNRAFITQTWEVTLNEFPEEEDVQDAVIYLEKPPIASITSIKYYDTEGVLQTLPSSVYALDENAEPGTVYLKYGQVWPFTYEVQNAVTVRFVCGWTSAANVPAGIKAAMLLLIGHLYAHREAVNFGNIVTEVPLGMEYLLDPYRIVRL